MGTRLTIFNQKGGVGKTTTVLNLGAALARRGAVPLLIDMDAQAHLSSILNPAASSGESLFAYYSNGRPLRELARPVRFGGEILPAHSRSEEHTSELQSHVNLVCRLLLEKKKKKK